MFFSFSGSIFHSFAPKYEILSVPWYTLLTIDLENWETCLKFEEFSAFNLKILPINDDDNLL